MSLITFCGRQVSISEEAYGPIWRSDPALRFHIYMKNILICALKMNKGLMGLEQHE